MPYRLYGGATGLTTGLALFISCNETSDGTIQVNRADSSVNGRTFTDVNTTPSVVASSGHPYTNQCFPSSTTSEHLTRANDSGLQVGAGDGYTVAVWVERKGNTIVNAILVGMYNSVGGGGDSWAIATTTTGGATIGVTVAVGQFLTSPTLTLPLDTRTLLVLSKPTGTSVMTLYMRPVGSSWSTGVTASVAQTEPGTRPFTINANGLGGAVNNNLRIGPVMYWPTRLLTSNDRDVLFNNGDGLTYEEF